MKSIRFTLTNRTAVNQLRYAIAAWKNNRSDQNLFARIVKLALGLRLARVRTSLKQVAGAAMFAALMAVGQEAKAQFQVPITNYNGLTLPGLPSFVDYDGDGDLDAVSQYYGNTYIDENLGGPGNAGSFTSDYSTGTAFSTLEVIHVEFGDLDNDGDQDAVVGGQYGELLFSENTGSATAPVFSNAVAGPFAAINTATPMLPRLTDIDNDGDLDLFLHNIVDPYGTEFPILTFFENTGTATAAAFAAGVEDPFGIVGPTSVSTPFQFFDFNDMDHDGDQDLLVIKSTYSGSGYSSSFKVLTNIGTAEQPDFEAAQNNTSGLANTNSEFFLWPEFIDVDQDGDMDFMTFEIGSYENKTYLYNSLPSSASFDITVIENGAYTFSEGSFAFNDLDGAETITLLQITSLPTMGILSLNGVAVTLGQQLTSAELESLVYTPNPGVFGQNLDAFNFIVSDGIASSTSNTVTINVDENVGTADRLIEQLVIRPSLVENQTTIVLPEVTMHQLTIVDAYGRTVLTQESAGEVVLDLSTWSAGHYFIRATDSKTVLQGRLVKK
jgi:FG-GAP-like repeat